MALHVTLGGITVKGLASVTWALSFGQSPFITTIPMATKDAERVLKQYRGDARETRLIVKDSHGTRLNANRVIVVGPADAGDPWTTGVRVADVRWYWPFKYIKRSYNIRRASGTSRLLAEGSPVEVSSVENDFIYRAATMSPRGSLNGTPWTTMAIAKDILDRVVGEGLWTYQAKNDWSKIDNRFPQSIEIDTTGDNAVGQAMGMLVGRDCYVGLEGQLVITDRMPGTGEAVKDQLDRLPPLKSGGILRRIDRSAERPEVYLVGFTREVEVRHDFTAGLTVLPKSTARTLTNVAPVTDPSLVVDGKTLTQGTFAQLADLFTAWGSPGAPVPVFSDRFARRMFLNSQVASRFVMSDGGYGQEASRLWAARMGTVLAHYRQTFKINQEWLDRCAMWRPLRVAVLNTETGTRAPATVYASYCVRPTMRSLARESADTNALRLGWNVDGYTGGDLAGKQASPVQIQVMNHDEGILHFSFALDPFDNSAQILPSQVDNLPTGNPLENYSIWGTSSLSEAHSVAIIVSMVPAAPYDERQLYWIKKTPSDLGFTQRCQAPPQMHRIGAGLETVRHEWSDDKAAAVEAVFGFGEGDDPDKPPPSLGDPINKQLVDDLADTSARMLYSSLQDHWEGTVAVPMNDKLLPQGEFHSVAHVVGTNGALVTVVSAAVPPPLRDMLALLTPTARKVYGREVVL